MTSRVRSQDGAGGGQQNNEARQPQGMQRRREDVRRDTRAPGTRAKRSGAHALGAVLAVVLGGCTQAPDLSAIQAERAKPVQRYDITQALAANGQVIVGATQTGAALVSADAGKSWTRTQLGGASLIGLAACPDDSFVGIDFYRKVWSADARGGNWKSVALDKPRTPLAVTCDVANRWWVAGTHATLAVSADRGASWKVTDLNEDTQITALQFIDDKQGVAVGEFGLVLKSTDGGASWTKQAAVAGEFYPYAVYFASAGEGWMSGIAGQILHTQDGGASWKAQDNPTRAALYRLFAHQGQPYGVGAAGQVARYDKASGAWQALAYTDAQPVFLGAGASLDKQAALVIGGPGGLIRAIGTAN